MRNKRFDARERLAEKTRKFEVDPEELGADVSVVVYGCLFGGEIGFFRSPTYQRFFAHMDAADGFARFGWSNQFFLGVAAAYMLHPSEVNRVYAQGVHQEASMTLNLTAMKVASGLLASHAVIMR